MPRTEDAGAVPDLRAGVVKRSLSIAGHRTSISLEDEFWIALKDEAAARGLAIPALVAEIDALRGSTNLSSAIRVHVLRAAQARARAIRD